MALTITINITDDQENCLKNDLLDIQDWVEKAVESKINNCAKRLDQEWRTKLDADPNVTSVPADMAGRRAVIFAHADYKDRATKEAEAKAARETP